MTKLLMIALLASGIPAAMASTPGPDVLPFVVIAAPSVTLRHVTVIIAYTAPRLYPASGVTTLRTRGSVEPYTDLKVRSRIEAGLMPGPHLDLTGPYLEGSMSPFAQMDELASSDEAREFVDFWAQSGMTSFKAYMHFTRA